MRSSERTLLSLFRKNTQNPGVAHVLLTDILAHDPPLSIRANSELRALAAQAEARIDEVYGIRVSPSTCA